LGDASFWLRSEIAKYIELVPQLGIEIAGIPERAAEEEKKYDTSHGKLRRPFSGLKLSQRFGNAQTVIRAEDSYINQTVAPSLLDILMLLLLHGRFQRSIVAMKPRSAHRHRTSPSPTRYDPSNMS
jgi:hypothetical protein